jgi:hypothetical protein
MSQARMMTTSPGRIPVSTCSLIIRAGRLTSGSTFRIVAQSTARMRLVSFAALLPFRSPSTVCSRWCISGGTSSSDPAHFQARLMQPTQALMKFRLQPSSIIACRTAFSASGPKSQAGVPP